MALDVYFNDTDFVSADEENPDTIVITFNNTDKFLVPKDPEATAITDGYKVRSKVPVQMPREQQAE
jgi:hypothetical protein